MSTGDRDFDAFFSLVGLVASRYAGLDAEIRKALGEVLGDSPRARAVADALSTEQATKALGDAIQAHPVTKRRNEYVRWVLSGVRAAGNERAAVAHSSWYLVMDLPDDQWSGRAISAKNRSAEHRRFTRDDLWQLEVAIDQLIFLVKALPRLADEPSQLSDHLNHESTVLAHEALLRALPIRPFAQRRS